jgi:hypothetical protein
MEHQPTDEQAKWEKVLNDLELLGPSATATDAESATLLSLARAIGTLLGIRIAREAALLKRLAVEPLSEALHVAGYTQEDTGLPELIDAYGNLPTDLAEARALARWLNEHPSQLPPAPEEL